MRRGAILLCALIATAAAAEEYFYLPFKMPNTSRDPFPYYVDGRSPSPAGLSLASVDQATRRAWKQWDDVTCAATAFSYKGLATVEPDPYDLFNVSTTWITSEADPLYDLALGSSDVTAMTLPLSYAGVLQQCDIFLNAANKSWTTAGTTAAGLVDVESIVLHEVGHCQGLDHTYLSSFDVMYDAAPIGEQRRTLKPRDIDALCRRYPTSGAVGAPCELPKGCGSTAGLKCVAPALSDGGTAPPVCVSGCPTGRNYVCPLPYVCQSSALFGPDFDGACLPPGETVTQVGRPCEDGNQCGSNFAACQLEGSLPSGYVAWKDGYCTQDCSSGRPACPAGSACVAAGEGQRCLKECRIGSGDCRAGYTCAFPDDGQRAVCIPSCHSSADCGGATCRTCDGTCLAPQNPTGQIGDACTSSATCGPGEACLALGGTLQRACTQACGQTCNACPTGSSCHPVGAQGERLCLRDCVSGSCPSGFQCAQLPFGRGCVPACAGDEQCPVGNRCVSGACVSPVDAGCLLCGDLPDGGDASPDAGEPSSGDKNGGCGCGAGGHALFPLGWMWGVGAWSRRRRR